MVFSDMHHFIGELAKKLRRGSSVLRISIRFELVTVPDFVVHSLIGYGNELLSDKLSQKVQWAILMNVPLLRQQKIAMLIGIESFRLAVVVLPRRPANNLSPCRWLTLKRQFTLHFRANNKLLGWSGKKRHSNPFN